MSNLAVMAVQQALYAKLHGDGALMGMVNGIYDVVPQRSELPYVVIGDGTQAIDAADAVNVTECRLTLHVWTESGGRKTALAIMNRLYALVHLGMLSLSGFQLVTMRAEEASTTLADHGTHLSGTLNILVIVAEE